MPGEQPRHPPTLDYHTPEPLTWRPNCKSILANTFSLVLYALLILAFLFLATRLGYPP
jgi:hypothetical protein